MQEKNNNLLFGNTTYYYSPCRNAYAIVLEICLAQILYLLEQENYSLDFDLKIERANM